MSIKIYKAPIEQFENNEIKPPDYLVEACSSECFVIHRVVKEDEIKSFTESELLMYNEDCIVTPSILECTSIGEAEAAIDSYWSAVKSLNQMNTLLCNN